MSPTTDPRRFDLVTLGRAAVDLYGEQVGGRLEDMGTFAKYLGGCPANIAVGASRLGLRVAMIARVGDEHMGRFVRESLAQEGVDVSQVRTDPHRLTALVILGIRDENTFPLIFYRENCADMAVTGADIDPDFVASAKALLVTGTHFSTAGTAGASRAAMAAARQAGTRVILDIDYRPVLWGLTGHGMGESRFVASDTVSRHLQAIVPDCDVVVGTEEEIHIAGGSTDTFEALRTLRSLTAAALVVKRGAAGCTIFTGPIPDTFADAIDVPGFPVDVFNVLGAGDGFMAGLLRGCLRDEPWERAGTLANACGALVVSRHGCAPAMASTAELDDFLARADRVTRLHDDARILHLHRTTTGRPQPESITALAFDHRQQFVDLAAAVRAPVERIGVLKGLIAEALLGLPGHRAGALVDGRFGREALARLTGTGRWIARPVERPGSRPLAFDFPEEPALHLRTWPIEHVAKCLVTYRADDPDDLCSAQEASLLALQRACHGTGRRFLLEVIPTGWEADPGSVTAAVERLYEAGLTPDLWKLPPMERPIDWATVSGAVRRLDPQCGGILVLGLDRPEPSLATAFEASAGLDGIRGFAIGRSVFRAAAEGFLSGRLGPRETIEAVRVRYSALLMVWDRFHAPAPVGSVA
ncbi:bifunctional 5-dehydro-2-deoxygluconokinase/5-dehydro-2-deoxyphosphogluconate aldolase [Prosthecodimorpha staleyi]|uniref:5-dehydro-2-deoxygluconokinase n=1 Tax=Prosthecodimorpha staleyi TaxID=2840188 RepID=A0A947GFS5_9HYPH|nr:5-dehydro-2-deoxygluconokinase [Prosthecodimorpha staleyi]MBT9290945.1 5-dehydro-2-deoxygluconokinase [Prosthecodimorpha staleyi]